MGSRSCQLHAINKGTVSRYLSGNRVPGDRWFLDQLLALRIRAGTPVTDDVRDHLIYLHLQALEVAYPHEYRVLAVKDELETAVTSRRESDRYVRSLEEQLNERNRFVSRVAAWATVLRCTSNVSSAWASGGAVASESAVNEKVAKPRYGSFFGIRRSTWSRVSYSCG